MLCEYLFIKKCRYASNHVYFKESGAKKFISFHSKPEDHSRKKYIMTLIRIYYEQARTRLTPLNSSYQNIEMDQQVVSASMHPDAGMHCLKPKGEK